VFATCSSVCACVCVCGSAGGRTVRPTGFPSEFLVLFTDNFKVFVAMPGDQFLLCAFFTRSRRNLVAGCSYPETKRTSVAFVQRKRKRAENYNKWHNNFIFLTAISISVISNHNTVSECCLIKLLPYILFEKCIYILALEMASPGNQYCASCIGTLSFTSDYKQHTDNCFVVHLYRNRCVARVCCKSARHWLTAAP